ncbi:MAG: EamA family transporter, partial [Alphaproteobacteria bacterium]
MSAELRIGIAYALTAGAIWGIGPLLLKRGMKYSNVSTATLVQQYVSVGFLAVLSMYHGELVHLNFSSRAFWAFFLAGAVGASFGKIFYYKGIDKVGASKATSVKNSAPFLTAVLAFLFLGEELTWFIAGGVTLIVLGIGVLTRVPSGESTAPGRLRYFLFPLIAALCFGINPIFKKVGMSAANLPILGAFITQTTALIVMLSFGRLLAIQPRWERVPAKAVVLFSLSGVTEALGSLFTFFALLYGPAAVLSPIWRISPLVTFALARFTLRGIEVVTIRDGLAASLIVLGVFVLSHG